MRRIQFLLAFILGLNLFSVPLASAAQTAWFQPVHPIISTPNPTPPVSELPTQATATQGRPPLSLTLFMLGFCCAFLLLIGVFVLGIVVQRQNLKKDKNN
jgi:hypothetical protein